MFKQTSIWLTRVANPKGCGPYRYLITSESSSWMAFRTLKGLREFLKCSNLKPKFQHKSGRGDDTQASFKLQGDYFDQMGEWDVERFNAIRADAERIAYSNGRPTLWKYVHIHGGGCLAYCLNPNVKERPEFDRMDVLDNQGKTESKKKGQD